MKTILISAAIAALSATPLLAESHASGDAAAGEKAFKGCQACHVVVNDSGETLAGKNAKTGPNLYGVAGRHAGAVADFNYSKGMVESGEAGLVWDEASFVAYVQDPTGFLREHSGDAKARSKMSFKVRKEQEAIDLYAYLSSLAQ